MPTYLVDENMPYYFRLWNTPDFIHQLDLAPKAKDRSIWTYAQENELIILTKDSDFSNRILLSKPPPWVVHFRIGNVSMQEFHQIIGRCWPEVERLTATHKPVCVYKSWLEAFA